MSKNGEVKVISDFCMRTALRSHQANKKNSVIYILISGGLSGFILELHGVVK